MRWGHEEHISNQAESLRKRISQRDVNSTTHQESYQNLPPQEPFYKAKSYDSTIKIQKALQQAQENLPDFAGVWKFPKRMVDEMIQTELGMHQIAQLLNESESKTHFQENNNLGKNESFALPLSPTKKRIIQDDALEGGSFMWFPLDENEDLSFNDSKVWKKPSKKFNDKEIKNEIPSQQQDSKIINSIPPVTLLKPKEKTEPNLLDICERFLESGVLNALDLKVLEESDD